VARHHAPKALEDALVFARAKVIDHGLGVGWPGDLEMSAAKLGRLAAEQRGFGTRDFVHWREDAAISNAEAAAQGRLTRRGRAFLSRFNVL
jgi:hypothetical protein